MVVDFEVTRTPSYTVASILKIGPYREDNLRSEFEELVSWAKKNRLRTGKWIMYEHDGPNSRRPGNQRRWEACLEIRGKAKAEGRIRIKKLPAQAVAHVVFNPNVVSSRIIYHGLGDWIWWRLKYKDFKRAGPTREVYDGDPWTNAKAWSKVDVQVLVEKGRPRFNSGSVPRRFRSGSRPPVPGFAGALGARWTPHSDLGASGTGRNSARSASSPCEGARRRSNARRPPARRLDPFFLGRAVQTGLLRRR